MPKDRVLAGTQLAVAVVVCIWIGPAVAEAPPEDIAAQLEAAEQAPPAQRPGEAAREAPAGQVNETSNKGPRATFDSEIVEAARKHALPINFFRQLIWQESRFRPYVVSRAGAQGIAQFMPGTAQWRGLADPFNPSDALHESARWLRELWSQFGNLGLAAAAYNAGPGRVSRWLAGRSSLPAETVAYVRIVTGEPAEKWSGCARETAKEGCPAIAPRLTSSERALALSPALRPVRAVLQGVVVSDIDAGPWGPWGLQLAGDWSQTRALADFKKIQTRFAGVLGDRKPIILRGQMAGRGSAVWYRVRVAEATRERAVSLCAKLEKAGGSCLVLRN